jgi:hypothetical protein
MAIVVDWPPQVLAAATVKLTTPISALLWMPEIDYPCLIGRIYMDLNNRFGDGRLIKTSQILRLTEEGGLDDCAYVFGQSLPSGSGEWQRFCWIEQAAVNQLRTARQPSLKHRSMGRCYPFSYGPRSGLATAHHA